MASNEPFGHIPRRIDDPRGRDNDSPGERDGFPGGGLTSDDPDEEQLYGELNLGFLRYPLPPPLVNPNIIDEVLDRYGVDAKKNTALGMMYADLRKENQELKNDNHHQEAQLKLHTRELNKITDKLRAEFWSKGELENKLKRAMGTCKSLWLQLGQMREQETQRRMIHGSDVLSLQGELGNIKASNSDLKAEMASKESLLIESDRKLDQVTTKNEELEEEMASKESLLIESDRKLEKVTTKNENWKRKWHRRRFC